MQLFDVICMINSLFTKVIFYPKNIFKFHGLGLGCEDFRFGESLIDFTHNFSTGTNITL